jgi:AraC-binding-like domain
VKSICRSTARPTPTSNTPGSSERPDWARSSSPTRSFRPQAIRRGNNHIGRFEKDCYYLGIEHIGAVDIRQSGTSFVLRPGRGSLYHANEPYELHSEIESRQFWIELPRAAFDRRFDSGRPRQLKNFDLTRGLGRIAADFCATLAIESGGLDEASRSKLGEQFMDLIALALNSEADRQSTF